MFEADEFAEEGVVTGIGVTAGLQEQTVEGAFGFCFGLVPIQEARAFEAWAGDFDKTGFDGYAVSAAVSESLADQGLTREAGKEGVCGDGV